MSGTINRRKPLPFTKVIIRDDFWAPRIEANRERGLNAVYQQLESTGRLEAYRRKWTSGSSQPEPHIFWDSDVAKWLEGACFSLIKHPNADLRAKVDHVVSLILSAQGEDGYINPHFTVVNPEGRWSNLRDKHELYCAGHLIEAAIAHHRATGDNRFLVGMRRYADLIEQVFGPGEDQRHGYPGHEEIELALIKLYRHVGDKRYLELARYFIEERGRSPHYYDLEAQQRGEDPASYWAKTHAYTQSHLPVSQQREVVGHAVRGMYLFSGMADLAAELDDAELLATLRILWNDLISTKMYLTGGIGPSSANEGFTSRFDLPNRDAYAETCAAIGLVFWAQRMLQIDLDSRYADVIERALFNGILSGISLEGDRFFYENPLASKGQHHRQTFYKCSCCPPNVNRLLPVVGDYIYGVGADDIAVHLYIQSRADFSLEAGEFSLVQQTDYPWDGIVCLRCEMAEPIDLTLKLRHPGWCQESRVYLNGDLVPMQNNLDNGYISIERIWQPGDEVRLQWVMPVRRVYAHPNVFADVGRVALMRGPLLYCFEDADHIVPVDSLRLSRGTSFDTQYEPGLLGGVVTIHSTAGAVDTADWGQSLYRTDPPVLKPVPIKGIPYYLWDNREPGAMLVWVPED